MASEFLIIYHLIDGVSWTVGARCDTREECEKVLAKWAVADHSNPVVSLIVEVPKVIPGVYDKLNPRPFPSEISPARFAEYDQSIIR